KKRPARVAFLCGAGQWLVRPTRICRSTRTALTLAGEIAAKLALEFGNSTPQVSVCIGQLASAGFIKCARINLRKHGGSLFKQRGEFVLVARRNRLER